MKKNNLLVLMTVMFVGALYFTSCKKDDPKPADPCENVTCENNGTCNNNGTCDCPDGFTGTNCETAEPDPCENVTCENNGTCNDNGTCDCPDGFTGTNCETVEPDPCENVTCENNGTCNDNGTCDCPDGFTGTNCETVEPDPCENVTCENDGTCENGTCNCPDGFTGENCEIMEQVEPCDTIDATFKGDVADVLSVTCSYDACHGPASTFGLQDYNVFSNLKPFLDDGSFEKRVLEGGDMDNAVMPPAFATEGPTELTEEQLQILMCWKEAGYPEE